MSELSNLEKGAMRFDEVAWPISDTQSSPTRTRTWIPERERSEAMTIEEAKTAVARIMGELTAVEDVLREHGRRDVIDELRRCGTPLLAARIALSEIGDDG